MAAALFVPWCLVHFGPAQGWRMAFIFTGGAGFVWLIFWFWLYEPPARQRRLSRGEYDHIHSDDAAEASAAAASSTIKITWRKLLGYSQTWAFFLGKFLTDGVWWFYLFWLPDYLKKQFGMTAAEVRFPTFVVYGVAIVGSVFGGSLPLTFMKRGLPVHQARMCAMLLIALFPLVALSTQYFGNVQRFGSMAATLAVATICVAAAAHQAWSANLFTIVSDMYPKKAVGTVTGIGAMAGGLGGVALQKLAGGLTDHFIADPQTAYRVMFCTCSFSYLLAWGLIKTLVPRSAMITDL
jgi:ACS family hexuronate transporter-like MFS transporter